MPVGYNFCFSVYILYTKTMTYKVKNCFYLLFMNDGEFISYY